MNKPTAIELFAGAGGLSIGLGKAGFNVVLSNEIEPEFADTLQLNHPDMKVLRDDIRNIDFLIALKKLGLSRIDLVSGGPPCQGFSTVGSKNAHDPRNSLFYEYIRAVKEINPDYTLFENVSGFKRMYGGQAYKALLQELGNLGYECISGILEASDFGLPQKRARTIIVGWRIGLPKISLPTPTHSDSLILFGNKAKLTIMDAISDLPPIHAGEEAQHYLCNPKNDYQKELRAKCTKLTEHNAAKYGKKMKKILSLIPPGGCVNDLPEQLRPKSYFANTYARLLPNQPAPTITRNFGTPSSSRCVHPFQNRALSTREGARLQGFPDDYIFVGSKSSKNLQIGNAVPPIFGLIIAQAILTAMPSRKITDQIACLPLQIGMKPEKRAVGE